jgi:DNA-binding NtrC family response regulator
MEHKPRILIVEDELEMAQMIVQLLDADFGCTSCQDIGEAQAQFGSHAFDLVITDLHLPDGNGLELMEKLRRIQATLPFIIITGTPIVDTAVTAVRMRAVAYLTKPFDFEELKQLVIETVEKRNMTRDPLRDPECKNNLL